MKSCGKILLITSFICAASQIAEAQTCPPYPNTLTNGTAADANAVMDNFSAIMNCVNNAGGSFSGGFINKFRNGTMDVWQRGISLVVTTAGAYTADGWFVAPTGANVTIAAATGIDYTVNSLQMTGATGVTDVTLKQPIESYISASFFNQPITVQFKFVNNTGVTVTPALTVKSPNAQDNYTNSTTLLSAVNLQACASGATCTEAYTFTGSTSSNLGTEIDIDFGNNFATTSKSVKVADLDIRVTSGVATGLNSNPPPPELRPISTELAFNQRYFLKLGGSSTVDPFLDGYAVGPGQGIGTTMAYPVTMRANPTATTVGSFNNSNVASTNLYPNVSNLGWQLNSSAAGNLFSFGNASAYFQLSAEIAP